MRPILLITVLAACTAAPPAAPDAADDSIRYPRLGLLCECDEAGATPPCTAAACGPGASCDGRRCGATCTTSQECPAGAWCDPNSGSCWWTCSTDADCVDPAVDRCAPVGACYGPVP